MHPISDALVAGFEALGFPHNDDFDGARQDGFGRVPVTQRAVRWSAADGYLHPVLGRTNLDLRMAARVTRVVVQEGRSLGVDYIQDGRELRVLARGGRGAGGRVGGYSAAADVLGGGATCRPRGGRRRGRARLARVGRNLQDQMFVPVTYRTGVPTMKHAGDQDQQMACADHQRGMLSSNLTEAGGFVRTRAEEGAPDVELLFGAFGLDGDGEQFSVLCGGLQPLSTRRV